MFDYNKFFSAFEESGAEAQADLLEQLKVAVYFDYRVFFHATQDEASDFFCEFFPQLDKIVASYHPGRATFFTYLMMVIRRRFFNHIMKGKMHNRITGFIEHKADNLERLSDSVCENGYEEDAEDILDDSCEQAYEIQDGACQCLKTASAAHEPSHVYGVNFDKASLTDIIKKAYRYTQDDTRKKRMIEKLFLYRYCWNTSEKILNDVCAALGFDAVKAQNTVLEIRSEMLHIIDRERKVEARLNGYFYDEQAYKKLLTQLEPASFEYLFYQKREKSTKRHLAINRKLFLQRKTLPSVMVLSEILQIPYAALNRNAKKLEAVLKKTAEKKAREDANKKHERERRIHPCV